MDGSEHLTSASSSTEDGSLGSYALHELIRDVPLDTGDDGKEQGEITCVDAWNGNLYIGTSSGQVLHYVSIPPDPSDVSGRPSYIFATRIEPPFAHRQEPPDTGIKQMLLLPSVGKACILCNGTLSFYSLPELSPAFDGRIRQVACSWVGGVDRNLHGDEVDGASGAVIAVCLRTKVRMIRILGDDAKSWKQVELGGITAIERRGNLSCVANGASYSLLDVVNQLQNGLFPISSSSDPEPVEQRPPPQSSHSRQGSSNHLSTSPSRHDREHRRDASSSSAGARSSNEERLHPDNNAAWPARNSSRPAVSPASSTREPAAEVVSDNAPATNEAESRSSSLTAAARLLRPNILSPAENEFLLTTGTKLTEPGVGVFVNLDGDVVRGTIEFSTYPQSLVLDTAAYSVPNSDTSGMSPEGFVLAIVQKEMGKSMRACIEAQRWDIDPSEISGTREWLALPGVEIPPGDQAQSFKVGMRNATEITELSTPEISSNLRLRRLHINKDDKPLSELEIKRNQEEDRLAARFAKIRTDILVYANAQVAWVARNPLILQLDQQLDTAMTYNNKSRLLIDTSIVQRVFNSIRGQEPHNELEFLTLTYIRQKSSLLLFGTLVLQAVDGIVSYEHDKRRTQDALSDGAVDPRIILTLVSPLSKEIAEGGGGIWMPQGLRDIADKLHEAVHAASPNVDPQGPYGDNVLSVVKQYLTAWRKKKGFGSVTDETHVTQTVDAALLHTLLILDQNSSKGPALAGPVRAELNALVDRDVECFDRAVQLLEQFHRLYTLSRLYQSRKMTTQVLSTWRRILDGEQDAGGELVLGEQIMRGYLSKIRDSALVQEYGSWLANRNPRLGVQVFADDNSKVKFQPTEAVAILKTKAPGAVKDYLEHLVFGKNHTQYVNDLIAFYLDSVLHELKNSPESRSTLVSSYETYRTLLPPKPTYREFITDNALDAEWWHNRLRLLQLIGGNRRAAADYDIHALGERLAPYSNELVPEMIILNGREGKHKEALRLLTHGLGDFDTAIRYCLLGGSSVFHPTSDLGPAQSIPSQEEQSQLFSSLLDEFFRIEDLSERKERTAELLERFGGWFDVSEVLALIPDSWSVELVAEFLIHALRRLVHERNETAVVKALTNAQNLRQSVDFIEKCEIAGPRVVTTESDIEAG